MREHRRVRLCMGQVEASADGVAELVVDGHAYAAETGTAEPGTVLGGGARGGGAGVLDNFGEGGGEGACAFQGH